MCHTCEVLHLKLMEVISSPWATEHNSWSTSSSMRQAMSRAHLIFQQCLEADHLATSDPNDTDKVDTLHYTLAASGSAYMRDGSTEILENGSYDQPACDEIPDTAGSQNAWCHRHKPAVPHQIPPHHHTKRGFSAGKRCHRRSPSSTNSYSSSSSSRAPAAHCPMTLQKKV